MKVLLPFIFLFHCILCLPQYLRTLFSDIDPKTILENEEKGIANVMISYGLIIDVEWGSINWTKDLKPLNQLSYISKQ